MSQSVVTPDPGPEAPWLKIWATALVLIVGFLGSLELFWRWHGHTASISSDVELWCYHRERLVGADRATIALLGASRMQIGFMQDAFLATYPDVQLVQLSTPGKSPFAILRDVASDNSFKGIVLCSVEAYTLQPFQLEGTQRYVDHYRSKWGPGAKASLMLSCAVESRLVLLRPNLCGSKLLSAVSRGEMPHVYYVKTLFNRRRIADYSLVDVPRLVDTRIRFARHQLEKNPPVSREEWSAVIEESADLVRAIGARGGEVVFVRFPMQGRFLDLNEELLPDRVYWDRFEAGAATHVLDYLDMPGYESLHCADQSHLDHDSAVRFTLWIGRELDARGLLP